MKTDARIVIAVAALAIMSLVTSTITASACRATYYGSESGARTATGERFNSMGMTAAHPSLPLNTIARVTDQRTGRAVIVRINDRGPAAWTGNCIDLAHGAMLALTGVAGTASVSIAAIASTTQGVSAVPNPNVHETKTADVSPASPVTKTTAVTDSPTSTTVTTAANTPDPATASNAHHPAKAASSAGASSTQAATTATQPHVTSARAAAASAAAAAKAAAAAIIPPEVKIGQVVLVNDYITGRRVDFPAIVSALNTDGTLALFAMPAGQAGRPLKAVPFDGKEAGGACWHLLDTLVGTSTGATTAASATATSAASEPAPTATTEKTTATAS